MSELIRVPDIGNGEGEVIELLVKVGDRIEAEQSLLTLESDKASMEIPAPRAGVITRLLVKLGDKLKTGDDLLELDSGEAAVTPPAEPAAPAAAETSASATPAPEQTAPAAASTSALQDIQVPDIGSSGKARIIELLVKVGDTVATEQSLLVLESDKASMEIPSPAAGVVTALHVKLEDEVGTGDPILQLQVSATTPSAAASPAAAAPAPATPAPAPAANAAAPTRSEPPAEQPATQPGNSRVHAGPAVRQLARELGADLAAVTASGPHGRILKEDVQQFVKQQLQKAKQAPGAMGGSGIPPVPEVDFSKFGPVEEIPMTRLMQVGAANLHRSWLNVPHVTQFDNADISELEAFRIAQKATAEKAGVKLTVLPFLLKACAHLLLELPDFNSSLAPSGKALLRKGYVHIGFAVDTPDGLLVPVLKDVDKKSLLQLAAEAAELAEKARTKKLLPDAMQGACFTISSLGHIGGTGFTPIVNAPEVAILGVSKASMQPVWDGQAFQPKLLLPLSLSYDHRVINGAAAARFTRRLGELLGDIRTLLL
ncbi:pyruvate dehydrogenase E2 component (dihydrolipoamide acetyltransferase) [Pseudomonas pohangensis]|uniref:Acetyltransferase component of pyruvate dehydrogenase complex n=1 Tax=Pseudomonas pohangensis TaxID=364197 RepID=A0A1H2HAX3_9PSED|nr:dihydrolipoyllysine-residue acetyltransferase [Pseudomonas pohangensis]SDU29010.1 pyruvate dehydrogenase E2 component (dihydrolipoamide acetyltransferase) [Pseudomonas pohangensis]